MTQLPAWAIGLVALGTPVLAFAGALIGHLIAHRSATGLDKWHHREETMRLLRWAAELAVGRGQRAEIGVAALDALVQSELLQPEDEDLVNSVFEVVLDPSLDGYAEGDPIEEEGQ